MDGVKEAFEIVFGEEFINEMFSRLIIILSSLAAALFIILFVSVWKLIATQKIKKAILLLSEYPDNYHADVFVSKIKHITPVGKMFARIGKKYSGLSKDECRNIFNTTIVNSPEIDEVKLVEVRKAMISVGCKGLLGIINKQ